MNVFYDPLHSTYPSFSWSRYYSGMGPFGGLGIFGRGFCLCPFCKRKRIGWKNGLGYARLDYFGIHVAWSFISCLLLRTSLLFTKSDKDFCFVGRWSLYYRRVCWSHSFWCVVSLSSSRRCMEIRPSKRVWSPSRTF